MVMGGKKAYAVKCEKCGHEDAVFFRVNDILRIDVIKDLAVKIIGKKCPKCGGRMKVDPGKHIVF